MNRKIFAAVIVLVALISSGVFGDELTITSSKPTIDGIIGVDEYSYVLTETGGDMVLYLNRTEDTLSIAISAETEGWIAVGLGEMRMNKATIFIGYVTGDGANFSVQQGQGHRHRDGEQSLITSYQMTETDGSTYLEVDMPVDEFIGNRDKALEVIFAYGAADSFQPYHKYRGAAEVALKR